VATGQLQLSGPVDIDLSHLKAPKTGQAVRVELQQPQILSILGPGGSSWEFDLTIGALTCWTRPSHPNLNILTEPLSIDLYRALTDNDRGGQSGPNWHDSRLHQAKPHLVQARWSQDQTTGTATIIVEGRIAPPVLSWSVNTTTAFTFGGDDKVHVHVHARPQGALLPETFARFGLATAVTSSCERVRWFGRGPGESYRDKKRSQLMGTWEAGVDELFVEYEFPQDGSGRTDVRWVEFLDGSGERLLRARFSTGDGGGGEMVQGNQVEGGGGCSFQAVRYSTKDIDEAQHPFELRRHRRVDTVVHLDWMHHGLGTGSCGPDTLEKYQLRTDREFDISMVLD
jgi:beta-galactosidase